MHLDLPHGRDLMVGTLLKFLSETFGANIDVDMIPMCNQNAKSKMNHVKQRLVLAGVFAKWHSKSDSLFFFF